MKITRFFAIAMAATILLSCSEDKPKDNNEPAGRSKMTIKIKGETETSTGGRAAGSPTASEESTVNNFIIYVFKSNGDNDITPKEYTSMPSGGRVSDLEITTDAKEVYVIANTVSNPAVNDQLKAVTKKSDLQAVIGRGFDGPSATALPTQTSTNLWMSGTNDVPLVPVDGGNTTTSVTLKYVGAKLRLTSVTLDQSVTDLTLSNVIVLNGGGATTLIPTAGTSLIPSFTPVAATSFYISGVVMTNFANKPAVVGRNNEYSYTLNGDFKIETGKNQQYFYVFENDGAHMLTDAHPTILTLKAMDSEFNDIYYSVFFKADPDGSLGYDDKIIERGKSYDVTMKIKKMINNSDPTIPALKTTVEVTITPATWQTENIDKTYE